MKYKTLFVTFKGLSLKQINPPFLVGENLPLRKYADISFVKEAQSIEKFLFSQLGFLVLLLLKSDIRNFLKAVLRIEIWSYSFR